MDTIEEYKQQRKKAANSTDLVRPFLTSDSDLSGLSKEEFYRDLFLEGYESLESLEKGTARWQFEELVRLLVKEIPGVDSELVDDLEPKKEFCGIEVYDPSEVRDVRGLSPGVHVNKEMTPFTFLRYDGEHWWHEAEPWKTLELPKDGATKVFGKTSPDEFNQRMMSALNDFE